MNSKENDTEWNDLLEIIRSMNNQTQLLIEDPVNEDQKQPVHNEIIDHNALKDADKLKKSYNQPQELDDPDHVDQEVLNEMNETTDTNDSAPKRKMTRQTKPNSSKLKGETSEKRQKRSDNAIKQAAYRERKNKEIENLKVEFIQKDILIAQLHEEIKNLKSKLQETENSAMKESYDHLKKINQLLEEKNELKLQVSELKKSTMMVYNII